MPDVESSEPGLPDIDPNERILRNLDYGYRWNLDVEHIIELYQVCRAHPGRTALELGSFRGNGTLALALAGKEVTSIDISDEHLETRQALLRPHQLPVTFLVESSQDEFRKPETYDIILHDNTLRGAVMLLELELYWKRKLNPGGLLMVHNVEKIRLPELLDRLQPESHIVTADSRRRQLAYFAKPGEILS
ncbi:MAG: class I SAM-dependent methyltransferase [Thermomicrobiales bacterium]|nr:class I SAM-dependent methyltransferase [Thermomicrobiales bacterium]